MNVVASPNAMLLMMGIQDSRQVTVTQNASNGSLSYTFLGNSRIATDLAPRFKQRLVRIFFGPKVPIRIPPGLREHPMVNAIGDSDMAAIALRMLEEYLEQNKVGCFNHPSAILGSGRDGVADKLANIPGLHMPRTIRTRIDEPTDLQRLAEEHGLTWPIIVRVTGTHRGSATTLVDSPAQAKGSLRGLPWGGHEIYLTEYVDCRDADGHYRKLRLVMVGKEIFLRHLVIANGWLVHVHDRELGHLEEEIRCLQEYPTGLLPKIRDTMFAVAEAMDMDFFGMDCSLRPDGRLLVFEVNVLMDILLNTMASPNCWDEPIARIHDALAALMFDPTRWRHPQRAAVHDVA